MTDIVNKVLENVDKMPSLPTSVSKILEITKNPEVSPKDLNKVIMLDPILTGKVLQLVNSAYYSLSERVTSIVKAIILVGVNTLRNLALSTAVVPIVDKAAKKSWMVINVEGYWKHSIGTGVTAKLIAKRMNVDKSLIEEYFIGGLLHDIGKVVLDHALQEKYLNAITKSNEENIPLIEVEDKLLEINHVQVGTMLAEKWGLSNDLKEVISFHHNPKECNPDFRQIVYAVNVANNYCNLNKIGFSGNMSESKLDPELLSFLNIKEDEFDDLKEIIFNEIKKASVFMHIK